MREPKAPEQAARDAYKRFGKAVEELVGELLDAGVPPGHVTDVLPSVAGVPVGFGPLIAQIVCVRAEQARAARAASR